MTRFRRVLIGAAVLLVLAIAVLAIAARSFLGGDGIRRAIEAQASAALERPVTIGSAVPRLYPRVGVELRDVAVGAAREATIDYVRLSTGIRGLLRRRVEGAEVSVERSRIDIRWALASVAALATASPSSTPSDSGYSLAIDSIGSIAFRDVTLVAGGHTLVVDMDSSLSGGDRIVVSRLDAKSDASVFRATGEIASVAKKTGSFDVDATTIDLDGVLAFLASATPAGAQNLPASPSAAPAAATTPFDVAINIKAAKGRTLGIALSQIIANGRLRGERVEFGTLAFNLFDGHYAGSAAFVGSAEPRYEWRGKFERLDVPQLVAFAGSEGTMTGKLAGSLDIGAAGADPMRAIERARGTARLTVTDGVVPGLEIVRPVVLAFGKPTGAPPPGSGEAFSRIAATFDINGTNASTQDLTFASRDLDLRGSGRLSFASKTVDLRADVVLSEELSAQAGRDLYRLARDGKRIVLPATITGSMSSPTVFVDIQSALQRALRNRTEDALKDLFDRFRKKE